MVKIRLTALPDELPQELKRLKENHTILAVSNPERNRNSKYYRQYIDAESKESSTENIQTADDDMFDSTFLV